MTTTFSVTGALKHGWHSFAKAPWVWVGTMAIAFIAQMIVSFILPYDQTAGFSLTAALSEIASFIVSSLVAMGMIHMALSTYSAPEKVDLKKLWYPRHFLSYIGVSILMGLAILVGLVLLIVPGIYLALMFFFATLLVVDRGLMPIAALKESARMTKGKRWSLFLFSLLLVVVNLIAAVLILLPLLVSVPVSMLATVHIYNQLKGGHASPVEKKEEAPAPSSI